MMEPGEGRYSVSMPGAEIGTADIASQGASVSMPGTEIRSAAIGSEAASVAMPGAEIGTAVMGDGASVHTNVHHHYYGRNPGGQVTQSVDPDAEGRRKSKTPEPEEGYSLLTKNIFMSKIPVRKGVRVYKAYQEHANGHRRPLAVKVIHGCEKEIRREVQHLVTLASHPNIVQIIDSVAHDGFTGTDLYIVMELCGGKDLQDYLENRKDKKSPLDFYQTMSFSIQILNGLKHIHHLKIIHRDLKPENILLLSDGENLKLTDFGISKELRDGRSSTRTTNLLGSDGFRAPETFSEESEISQMADIFSLGIILYQLWSDGKHAFGQDVLLRNYNICKNSGLDLSGLCLVGKKKNELLDLLHRMLQADPRARPTIDDVLHHPFFESTTGEGLGSSGDYGRSDDATVDQSRKRPAKSELVKHRKFTRLAMAEELTGIGAIDGRSKTMQIWKQSDRSWNFLHDVPGEICKKGICAVAVDRVIFVLSDDTTGFKIDLSKPNDGWSDLPRRSERGDVQVAECCGRIYAFHNKNLSSAIIEVLETQHTSWKHIIKPEPCENEAITEVKGCLYTFGGFDGSYLRRSKKFDPTENLWESLRDMPTGRTMAAAAAQDNKIYVMGGLPVWHTTECFDVTTNEWSTLKPMNNPRVYFNAFVVDRKIYAFGSSSTPRRKLSFIIEEYDPVANNWKDILTVTDKEIHSKVTFMLLR